MSADAKTKVTKVRRIGVIGTPIGHSLSPLIHQVWLDRAHILMRYEKLKVETAALANFLALVPEEFCGVNITLPHKQKTYDFAQAQGWQMGAAAAASGSVNMLAVKQGAVFADSTDGAGFLHALESGGGGGVTPVSSHRVMIIGAGGAAFAIAYALKNAGVENFFIVNRTHAKALALAEKISSAETSCEVLSFSEYKEKLAEVSLLVQASTLGMRGAPPLNFDLTLLPRAACVMDIVYQPLATPLLVAASARGNPTIDGLAMLMEQAKLSFEQWFDAPALVDDNLRHHLKRFIRD